MPVINTALVNRYRRSPEEWYVVFQVEFDDGRIRRGKRRVPDSVITAYDGTPEIPGTPEQIIDTDGEGNPIDPPVVIPAVPGVPAIPPDPTALDAYVAEVRAAVESQIKLADAEAEIQAGDDQARGEATRQDVWREYVKRAFLEQDTIKALSMFDKFFPTLQAYGQSQGWAAADYANALQTTVANVQRLNQRWQYLNGNRAAIEAFVAIAAGDDF